METLIKHVQALLTALVSALDLLADGFERKLKSWFTNLVKGALLAAAPLLADVEGELAPIVAAFVRAFQANGGAIENVVKAPAGALAQFALNTAANRLTALGPSTPDNAIAGAATAMDEAFGFGIASAAVTAAFEAAFPEKLNTLNGVGPMLANMAGFEEISKAIREPLYDAAFGKSAQYHYRSVFKPELPDEADAVTWHSRRLLDDTALRKLFGFSGLKPEYEDPFVKSAYRAISPFMLAAGFTDQDYDPAVVQRAAEFMGLRDEDVQLILNVVKVRSLQNVRNSYIQEAMTAYGQGVISDAELNSAFDDAQWGQEARALAFKRALLLRRIAVARDVEAAVVPQVRNGVLDDISGLTDLETAGIQPWKAQLQIGKADAGAAISARKKLLSEQAKAEAQRKRNLKLAAIAEFQRGVLNDATLLAALLAIPLGPLEAASIVAVQDAIRNGKLKFLYGKLRQPQEAATLHIQVSAIGDQVKKELLTPDAAVGALRQLGLDDKDIQALVAEWAALRGKPTTTGVFRPV